MTKYFKQVEGLPAKKGEYMTDHGYLKFDGKTFLISMGRYTRPVPTTVSWYLEPFNPFDLADIPMDANVTRVKRPLLSTRLDVKQITNEQNEKRVNES